MGTNLSESNLLLLVFPAKAGIVRLRAQSVREVQVLPRYAYSGL